MKIPSHPAIDFIRAYWVQILVLLLFVAMAIANVAISMENRVMKATLKNATTTIANYEAAAKDNLATIGDLKAANQAFADAADSALKIAEQQAAELKVKEQKHDAQEQTLRAQLEKAHAQNKIYSDAVVPDSVARRLRENGSQN